MRRADRGKDQRDLVALDQPARLLDRLGRRVAVVERNQIDLAAVDAAALVQHLEIADLALAKRAEGGNRTAIGHGLAYFDLGCGDAARLASACGDRPRKQRDQTCYAADACSRTHLSPHISFSLLPSSNHAMSGRWTPFIIAEPIIAWALSHSLRVASRRASGRAKVEALSYLNGRVCADPSSTPWCWIFAWSCFRPWLSPSRVRRRTLRPRVPSSPRRRPASVPSRDRRPAQGQAKSRQQA